MSPRKRNETIWLAILAIASVMPMRFFVEERSWFLAEIGTLVALFAVAKFAKTLSAPLGVKPKLVATSATTLLAVTPVVFAVLARTFGSPIAFEMSALTAFGSASLAIAIAATNDRTRAMSLVISGFLVLFTTSISDDPRAVWLAVLWMGVCVWHLVANHWEKLDLCLPDSVRPTIGVRPASVLLALVVCIVGGLMVRDRFGPSNRFSFGIMPASGGSKWSDPAARSGIGTGEAAIAAKDHAESFGAVDSDIFLESTESTLFDMFNDSIGEPKKKNKWERRQAMGNENVIPMHERAAKSEKGSSSFSTDRMPPPKHRHFSDTLEAAIVQWDGPTGVRLAMERYDSFDGVEWTNTANLAEEALQGSKIGQQVWFFDPELRSKAMNEPDAVDVNLLKVLRLDTTRLPAPMNTAGVYIKDVNRQDFFGIDSDGCWYMPGREKVPPMTVVHLASLKVSEDELIDNVPEYEALNSIVKNLRTQFTLDRTATTTSDDPVGEFLKTRRGGDHLFATVAAMKAREIGLQSRIVTGFYVRPDAFDITAGHANVTADDVHVWAEIQLNDGRWFEIEPTPGYREPVYAPSMWLITKRFAAAYWIHGSSILGVFGFLFLTRLIWIEWLLTFGWSMSWPLGRHRQLRLAMKIVETRAKLIGKQRPVGTPQRDWLESLVVSDVNLRARVQDFCNDADRSIFGGAHVIERRRLSGVVRGLNARRLKMTNAEVRV